MNVQQSLQDAISVQTRLYFLVASLKARPKLDAPETDGLAALLWSLAEDLTLPVMHLQDACKAEGESAEVK
jgi:hypothetical protein